MDFYVLLTIPLVGISLLVCSSPFLLFFFFLFGRGGLFLRISSLALCPFLFFSFSFSFLSLALFCLFSFPDENHQRLESGAIPSNHWAGSANAMIVLRIPATFVVPSTLLFICRELAFYNLSSESVEKSLTMLRVALYVHEED